MTYMHSRKAIGWIVVLLSLALAACQSEKIDNAMLVDPRAGVSFADDVLPILTGSCGGAGCHIGETTSGVNLSNYAQVVTSVGVQYGGNIVRSGDGANSPLVDKVGPRPAFGSRMPAGGAALSSEQVGLIRTWIDEGAQDN